MSSNFLVKPSGRHAPFFPPKRKFTNQALGGRRSGWIYDRILGVLTNLCLVLLLLYRLPMSNADKKTTAISLAEPSQDTEQLLLQRLKNSSTDDDYFRWMLFVVGFYRGINKIEAATELLQGFITASKNPEHSAHCHLALGQIATDEQRFETALKHFILALELAPKSARCFTCSITTSDTVLISLDVSLKGRNIVARPLTSIGRARVVTATSG